MAMMTDIPDTIGWGTVTCRFGRVGSDSADAGRTPDVANMTGEVTLTPSVTWMQSAVEDGGRFYLDTLVCPVVDGVMYAPEEPATAGVPVVASRQGFAVPDVVQWTATFNLDEVEVQPDPVVFEVTAGETLDLAAVVGDIEESPYVVVVSTADRMAAAASAEAAGLAAVRAEDAVATAQTSAAEAQTYRAGAQAAQDAAAASATAAAATVAGIPFRFAQGRVTITPSAANVPTGASVVFPVDRFTQSPRLQVTAASNAPGTAVTGVGYSGTTTTGTTVYLTRTNTSATPVDWLAVQMTSTSADG